MKNPVFTLLALFLFFLQITAQIPAVLPPGGGGEFVYSVEDKCLSESDRQAILQQLNANREMLRAKKLLPPVAENSIVFFDWPLRPSPGLDFNDYYGISNFVDQDNSSGLLDYDCNSRTYNGHKGTDIFTWPFPWYIYDNDFVEIVAAASGTIINKDDGFDDDHCSCFGSWNAVYVQHADGSVAWYGHMKKNSLTTKPVGQTVAKGEYLGIVASSGCSTGPHLHLEVYDSGNNLIDPYQGACNGLNPDSWWAAQPPYRTPTVNAVLTHDAPPVHGCPGVNESPNFSNSFAKGTTLYAGTYYHDQLAGDMSTYRIRKPDNSVWQTWMSTSPATYNASWWWWSWVLPSNGPFGTWTFEVEYYGQTHTHAFNYFDPLPVELTIFTGREVPGGRVELNWATASEQNNRGFELEHAPDAVQWTTLDFIAGAGNSGQLHNYQFVHQKPAPGSNFYRLRQIDFDGEADYSNIIEVRTSREPGVLFFPNPTHGTVYFSGINEVLPEIKITDRYGNLVQEFTLTEQQMDISQLPAGLYFISTRLENQVILQRMLKL